MSRPVIILYATASGNTEELATEAASRLTGLGLDSSVRSVEEVSPGDLAQESLVLMFASTWGEGLPPPDAEEFTEQLAEETLDLGGLRFAVFALGSSAYAEFCGYGILLDALLAARGAERILPCAKSDVKFRRAFEEWWQEVSPRLVALAEADGPDDE